MDGCWAWRGRPSNSWGLWLSWSWQDAETMRQNNSDSQGGFSTTQRLTGVEEWDAGEEQSSRTQKPAEQRATGWQKWWSFKRKTSNLLFLNLCLELRVVIQLVSRRPEPRRFLPFLSLGRQIFWVRMRSRLPAEILMPLNILRTITPHYLSQTVVGLYYLQSKHLSKQIQIT